MNYSYAEIDPTLFAWAEKNSVKVGTLYKGDPVRSTNVVSRTGELFQLWVDPPNDGMVQVHAWDYKTPAMNWEVPITELASALDAALGAIKSWMKPVH